MKIEHGADDQELGGQIGARSRQRSIIVPKKFWSTVQTGTMSIMEDTIAIVSAQSAMGE